MVTDDVMLQSLGREPAIISLLKQQYDIDVNIRSLKSFMVFRLVLLYFICYQWCILFTHAVCHWLALLDSHSSQ